MMNKKVIHTLLSRNKNKKCIVFTSSSSIDNNVSSATQKHTLRTHHFLSHLVHHVPKSVSASSFSTTPRFIKSTPSSQDDEDPISDETEGEVQSDDGWEEEDEVEPEMGDGGDGGGVVLQNVPWGERALSIAHEVLLKFGDDTKLYAFKTTPRGYIYVRLDKLPNEYGCPSMEEMESYSKEYKKRLDEAGALGEIPDDLALEVSSPGAERILKVPDDLYRFKDMPMRVCYVEDSNKGSEQNGVFLLDSVDTDLGNCVWKMADVKENRDFLGKGRPLSRKQKDWRLNLPYSTFTKVTLFLDY